MKQTTDRRLKVAGLLVAGVAMALAPLSGCASKPRPAAVVAPPAYDTEAAVRLAAEALQAQRAGRLDESIELYRRALNANPELSGIWTNLGVALMSKQDFAGAADAFKRASELSPTDSRPLVNLGIAYLDRGWAEEALANFDQAIERDPRNVEALRGAVTAAQRVGREDEKTLEHIRQLQLIETDPKWTQELAFRRLRLESALRERDRSGRFTAPAPTSSVAPGSITSPDAAPR